MSWVDEFNEATQPHPLCRHFRVWQARNTAEGWVVFEIPTHWESTSRAIHLGFVQALDLGQGDGTRALEWLLDLADRHGVRVEGHVQRCGSSGLTVAQLRAWYRRHGFAVSKQGNLKYMPNSRRAAA